MKKHLYFLYFFYTALIVLSASVCVRAASSRVTFTNARSDSTSLYITKQVSAASGSSAPEDTAFSFSLKLNKSPAREMEYRLFRGGAEVFNYDGVLTTQKQEHQLPIAFSADRNGCFSLRAGDTVCVEGLKPGMTYELKEEPVPGYLQTEPPAGLPAAGTLTPEGASVVFHNFYQGDSTGQQEYTALEVQKSILFPSGLTPPKSPEFTFRLRINKKPWSGEYFSLINQEGEMISMEKTKADGSFQLRGGFLARFDRVPADTDYEILEEQKEGWRSLSGSSLRGTAVSPSTRLVFANTEVSFAVTKRLEEAPVNNTLFSFVLEKDGLPWEQAAYYLYRADGAPEDESLHHTDKQGQFFLMAGQSAVFTSGEPGERFSVRELPVSSYVQILPADPDGYREKQITDSAETLPFVNRYLPPKTQFFTVRKINELGGSLKGAVMELYGDRELTQLLGQAVSDDEGNAAFGEIEPGIYYLKEAVSPPGYRLSANPVKIELEEGRFTVNDSRAYEFDSEACLPFRNYRELLLPLTGGPGDIGFLFAGLAGITALFCILGKNRRRAFR